MKTGKKILVTGAAGFIGFHLCKELVKNGHNVVGLDNINDYYNVNLKYARLDELGIEKQDSILFLNMCISSKYHANFRFIRMNLEDDKNLSELFQNEKFDMVCNLAAQAGVRYSIDNPKAYVSSNIHGFINVLECCRHNKLKRLVYASSSSVYGNIPSVPFKESDQADSPISLYAATKKSNELMAHSYSHLYDIQTIGLRFFTVYGPWGRPDMALYLFVDAVMQDKPINVFNNGLLSRDFTYIDDIIKGVLSTLLEESAENEKYQLYNIGNSKPTRLMDFIREIEVSTGRKAIKRMTPMQDGDVLQTFADSTKFAKNFNYEPSVPIRDGVSKFISWYKRYNDKNL